VKKIPTVWQRDPEQRSRVVPEVHPDAAWVLTGEGTATRKFDGTCVLIRRDGMAVHAFTRREVKPGKPEPGGFVRVDFDEVTGKSVGWEPAGQSGYATQVAEALVASNGADVVLVPGTYELVGPKVQGNPEGFRRHTLVRHATAEVLCVRRDWGGMREDVLALGERGFEGVVFHHPDGRMAKIKARDYR
jgi:hypothetical protein